MDLGLRGRKSLVTGGTKGIGRAIANELAAEGSDVAICARTEADVEEERHQRSESFPRQAASQGSGSEVFRSE